MHMFFCQGYGDDKIGVLSWKHWWLPQEKNTNCSSHRPMPIASAIILISIDRNHRKIIAAIFTNA